MQLLTNEKGERVIQCDLFEARTFKPSRVIVVEGDWYVIVEVVKQETGEWWVLLQQIERPHGVGPDRVLFITGDAELSEQE